MGGSLSGHGAAWPLPTVTNAALHAALHRAHVNGKIDDITVHGHDHHFSPEKRKEDARKFGSLLTVGPFPVVENEWLFPRPLDAGNPGSTTPTFLPLERDGGVSGGIRWNDQSSLPAPLTFATANTEAASKQTSAAWWNRDAWTSYLTGQNTGTPDFRNDSEFSDTESTFGIGIDPDTTTQDGKLFYSAHYLRLRENCSIGLLAEAWDKIGENPSNTRDLVQAVFPNSNTRTAIVAGGQQRVCSVERPSETSVPLPLGQVQGFEKSEDRFLVKWVLLAPAVFPEIDNHPGGWLPSWIRHTDGAVMLKSGNTEREPGEGRKTWRNRIKTMDSISANLVASVAGKPVPVTGYALSNETTGQRGGAKPTHLAVPAGSVYYFTTTEPEKLAAALNWHGLDKEPTTIRNRRSTLFGEKGFGIGVCGTWSFHPGKLPSGS